MKGWEDGFCCGIGSSGGGKGERGEAEEIFQESKP